MDEVDFSDLKQLRSWNAERNSQQLSLIASREVLRVLANFLAPEERPLHPMTLGAFAALLIATSNGMGRPLPFHAKLNQLLFAKPASKGGNASRAQEVLRHVGRSEPDYYEIEDVFLFSQNVANIFSSAASTWSYNQIRQIDANDIEANRPLGPLWHKHEVPLHLAARHDRFVYMLADDSRWRFFHDWYLGIWEGTWNDRDLAHEVAKIDADIWEAGLDAVAQKIT